MVAKDCRHRMMPLPAFTQIEMRQAKLRKLPFGHLPMGFKETFSLEVLVSKYSGLFGPREPVKLL
jgi:hypothetical protein